MVSPVKGNRRIHYKVIAGRSWWGVFALAFPLAFILACAPTALTPTPTPAAVVATPKPEAPVAKRGGKLAYMCSTSANTLNPYVVAGPAERMTVGPIYETFLTYRYTPGVDYRIDYEAVPFLAEGWEQPNETTYIFRVRKGIKWHDGNDFTADDVVFSYNYGRDPNNAFPVVDFLYAIDALESTDKYTLKITTKGPAADLLMKLADPNMFVLPKHVYDRGDKFEKLAIGTGPFKYKEFQAGEFSRSSRNDDYWQKGRPYPDAVECFYRMDQSATIAAFVSKKFDLIHLQDKPQLDAVLRSLPDAKYATAYGDYGYSIIMKLEKAPFSDIRIRKAMHLAIDRQSLVKTAALGDAVINPPGMTGWKTGWIIPQDELQKMPGYRLPKDQDLAEAKRLLAEAGYPMGFKGGLLVSTEYATGKRLNEPIVEQLRGIGVDLTMEGTTTPALMTRLMKGEYDIALALAASASFKYQWNFFHSKGAYNKMGIIDPKLDEYLEAQRFVLDVEKRKKASIDMQRLMEEKLYAIPTIELGVFPAWQPWVHDYYYNPGAATMLDAVNYSKIWLDADKMPADRR